MSNEKVKFLLNWNHFTDHLSSCMTKLMTDISYSDIIIATADKHMIYSHRFVLANSSKYFQRLLKHMRRQREIQLVVALPEIKYDIFKILMNYMYKGETQVPHELLPSVIKAGQFLEINGLVNLSDSGGESNSTTGVGPTNASVTRSNLGQTGPEPRGSRGSNTGPGGHEGKKTAGPGTLREKMQPRDHGPGLTVSKPGVFRPGDKRSRAQNPDEKGPAESPGRTGENGKENRGKSGKLAKAKNSSSLEGKDVIQLPLKRKSSVRDAAKKASSVVSPPSASLSTDSPPPPKKNSKRLMPDLDVFPVKVKTEKEDIDSDDHAVETECVRQESKSNEMEHLDEKITIKEEPDDIEEVVYNELQCEFCHEVYSNPSDWVKHMTEHHEDRGFQTYKDIDKTGGGSAVITCVVCSCVCFSAAEWANHLRMWHTDRELAVANMTAPKKSTSKVKKKSGTSKK